MYVEGTDFVVTDQDGAFTFESLIAGKLYTIRPERRSLTFTPSTIVSAFSGDSQLVFTAVLVKNPNTDSCISKDVVQEKLDLDEAGTRSVSIAAQICEIYTALEGDSGFSLRRRAEFNRAVTICQKELASLSGITQGILSVNQRIPAELLQCKSSSVCKRRALDSVVERGEILLGRMSAKMRTIFSAAKVPPSAQRTIVEFRRGFSSVISRAGKGLRTIRRSDTFVCRE